MPLIRPEVQEVLRSAGILDPEKKTKDGRGLTEKLDSAGLSLDETLDQLAYITKNTTNETLRLKCIETSLKAHGALKESAPAIPSFTIVIQEAALPGNSSPQEVKEHLNLPAGVNPILLPRPLLKDLEVKGKAN